MMIRQLFEGERDRCNMYTKQQRDELQLVYEDNEKYVYSYMIVTYCIASYSLIQREFVIIYSYVAYVHEGEWL